APVRPRLPEALPGNGLAGAQDRDVFLVAAPHGLAPQARRRLAGGFSIQLERPPVHRHEPTGVEVFERPHGLLGIQMVRMVALERAVAAARERGGGEPTGAPGDAGETRAMPRREGREAPSSTAR